VDWMPGYLTTPQLLNRYLYVLNNPTVYTDPDGLRGVIHCADGYQTNRSADETVNYINTVNAESSAITRAAQTSLPHYRSITDDGNGNVLLPPQLPTSTLPRNHRPPSNNILRGLFELLSCTRDSNRLIRIIEWRGFQNAIYLPNANSEQRMTFRNTDPGLVVVLDLNTGESFTITWAPSSRHSDWSPATVDDTNRIKSIINPNILYEDRYWDNSSNWNYFEARPGIIDVNGTLVAVGYHLTPHGSVMHDARPGLTGDVNIRLEDRNPPIRMWPLGGHMCMYYGEGVSSGGTLSCNREALNAYNQWNQIQMLSVMLESGHLFE